VATLTPQSQRCGLRSKGRIGDPALSDGATIIRPLRIEPPSDNRGERNVHIDS
jgi:hypothetical protein